MNEHPINRVSGLAPIMMSLVALLVVAKAAVNFERFGPPPHEDGLWHLFMLAMFVQPPVILYFIYKYRREFRTILPVLGAQLSLWALSLGATFYFPGLS